MIDTIYNLSMKLITKYIFSLNCLCCCENVVCSLRAVSFSAVNPLSVSLKLLVGASRFRSLSEEGALLNHADQGLLFTIFASTPAVLGLAHGAWYLGSLGSHETHGFKNAFTLS